MVEHLLESTFKEGLERTECGWGLGGTFQLAFSLPNARGEWLLLCSSHGVEADLVGRKAEMTNSLV